MRRLVFYRDMQDNTENRELYIRIEKKKLKKIEKSFFAKLQTKVQKPKWEEENVTVMKLSPHKSKKRKRE